MSGYPLLPGPMGSLATPQNGRSMRATSTFRGGGPTATTIATPLLRATSGKREEQPRQFPEFRPAKTHVLMDVEGPGIITHMWITFLGPEAHPWAKDGSANHQELLLRIYWDGDEKPGGRGACGRLLCRLLRQA